ncbi:non-ribosomal peptide synthetase [Lentzea tibetensis]|uniref:Non-ribosomal peptide synthetase n=1 Tax=Lentzea tibetensis TaxID=2591470 RepID=A0A563F1F7_9PSEU|nr:non-ribosomal peptide synthetase [Lentzea tibetensis]TWP53815.1 non-ribosomal peptide synthetase [Lentzea tibetensis]
MSSKTLVELFAQSVRSHPDAAAVTDDEQQLSYRELDARSDALAHRLVELGVVREDRVAVHLRRGVDVVVAVLGVLKAGAAYLPIDTRYGEGRRNYMITEGRVRLVITEPDLADDLPPDDVLRWRSEPAERAGEPLPPPAPHDAACVLYTSGSTGQPKAIVLEHRQMIAFTLNPVLPELTPDDRTAQVASISFDPANFEIWCTLAAGAELVVLPSIPELLDSDIQRELKRRKITVMLAPAIAINHAVKVDRDSFAPLRILHSGGDVLLPSTCRDLLAGRFSGRLFNLYGPAETTTACTAHEVTGIDDDAESVPIGSAFDGYHLYVLDAGFKRVPVGEPGELYVGGAGVSRGYLNRPELTAERFVPDAFSGEGGAMYRTGDRVRDRGDGVLEYLGRVDTQVKIRGYRVEPGEVERAICANPDVREAAVIAVGEVGDKRLVAFLVPAVDTLSLKELRADLERRVADFLVPSEFIVLPAMPTDAHGKRDWEDLGHTASTRMRQRPDFVEPRTETERYLADLWERLLTVEHVGVHDDFFVLGGHSLLAVRVRSVVRKELGVKLKPRAVFESSVLEELAQLVDRTREEVLIS